MPELPEVETVVRTLRPRLVGKTVRGVTLNRNDILTPHAFDLGNSLIARTIRSIDRRAKRIVFTLDDGNRFYVHLGMSGRMTVGPAGAPIQRHTHLIVDFSEQCQLRFNDPRRFGGVWWMGMNGHLDEEQSLGPEPLAIRSSDLAARLKKTARAIKVALLDQKLIAGLGNIYVDESLFDAKIHPTIRAHRLKPDQVNRLTTSIKKVLKRAIEHRGSTLRDYRDADGESGGFQKLFRVYDREGEPCVRCKTPIKRIVLGGRSTHFCPNCQTKREGAKSRRKPGG